MGDKTGIQWTDASWNAVTGCTKVSAGCDNCYAADVAKRFWAKQYPLNADGTPRVFEDVRMHPDRLDLPLRWTRPRRVFVNSMADMFHAAVSREFIAAQFAIMAQTQRHTFQILTKRPGRMRALLNRPDFQVAVYDAYVATGAPVPAFPAWPLPNVWLGVSAEDQETANARIPELLATPAAVRWVSAEPLLGPISFGELSDPLIGSWLACHHESRYGGICDGCGDPHERRLIDWVVVGGESGPRARPMNLRWAKAIVDECREAGTAVFVKQLGAIPIDFDGQPGSVVTVFKLADSKGGNMDEFPEALRIREYPA